MRDNKFNIKGVIMNSSATIESIIDKIQILSIVSPDLTLGSHHRKF